MYFSPSALFGPSTRETEVVVSLVILCAKIVPKKIFRPSARQRRVVSCGNYRKSLHDALICAKCFLRVGSCLLFVYRRWELGKLHYKSDVESFHFFYNRVEFTIPPIRIYLSNTCRLMVDRSTRRRIKRT